jgi:hypothetical protein
MPNVLDVSDDYLLWDNTESATVTIKRAGVANVARSVSRALRRGINGNDAQVAGVQIGSDSVVWNIAVAELETGDEIEEGDTITDSSSVVWIVKAVSLFTWRTRWRAVCTKSRT